MKSLYNNDMSKYQKMMSQTMTDNLHGQQSLIDGGNMIPIKINATPNKEAYKIQRTQIHDKKGIGINNVFGNSPHTVSYALGSGDPRYRRSASKNEQVPSLAELRKQYPSLTQDKYDQIVRQVGKNDTHKGNPLQTNGFFEATKIKNGIDLAEQERVNRFKYGVKKPANVWYHEMDDARITGDQIRTNNFRGSMHERDREHQ